MNKINGVEQNEFVFSAIVQISEEVIKLASQHEGQVYGNYVTNILVPRLNNKLCDFEHNDINIEFVNESFLKDFETNLFLKYKDVRNLYDGSKKKQYNLYMQGMFIAHLTLELISSIRDTFDCNCVVYYYYENNVPTLYDQINNNELFLTDYDSSNNIGKHLIHNINEKIVCVSNYKVASFLTGPQGEFVDSMNQFLSKGWIVLFGKHAFLNVMTLEQLTDLLMPKVNLIDEYTLLSNKIISLQTQLLDLTQKRDALLVQMVRK